MNAHVIRDCSLLDTARARTALIGACLAGAILCLLSACQSPALQPESKSDKKEIAQAEILAREQNHTAAARQYEELARRRTAAGRNRQLLRAAREWLRSEDLERGESLLEQIGSNLSSADTALRDLVRAHVALLRKHPERALAELDGMPQSLSRDDVAEALELRTQALFADGRRADAIGAALDRERLLVDPTEIMRNRRLIWDGLQHIATSDADQHEPLSANWQVAGWLALAPAAVATSRNAFAATIAIDAWRKQYPEHSANQFLTQEIIPQLLTATTFPAHVALLLPLSSRERDAAIQVQDGFIAAVLQSNPDRRPRLSVYDSTAEGIVAAYQHAIADGATFVVGPLLKEDVATLIAAKQISVPTLALNFPENQTAPIANLFQFWLDPTEEAQQVATQIADQGASHGIALLPKTDWGERVYRAFDAELHQRGGDVVGNYFYDPSGRDYTSPVTTALHINESKARGAALIRALHTKLKFEPRPRSDIDFVFIGAEPVHGRMFRSLLRYYLADTVPVFATSEIFEPNAAANADLNGVSFPDMPWIISPNAAATQLRATIDRYWPKRTREPDRLYAFGFDACQLIPLLLSRSSQTPIRETVGLTGRLTINSNGYVHRGMDWARIDNGQLEAIDSPTVKFSGATAVRTSDGQPSSGGS